MRTDRPSIGHPAPSRDPALSYHQRRRLRTLSARTVGYGAPHGVDINPAQLCTPASKDATIGHQDTPAHTQRGNTPSTRPRNADTLGSRPCHQPRRIRLLDARRSRTSGERQPVTSYGWTDLMVNNQNPDSVELLDLNDTTTATENGKRATRAPVQNQQRDDNAEIRDGRLTAWVGRTTTTRLVPLNTRCRHCIRGGRRTIWFGRQRLVCGDDGCGKTSLQIDCVERRATGSVAGVTDERNLPATRRSLTETRWATAKDDRKRDLRACRANLSMQEFTTALQVSHDGDDNERNYRRMEPLGCTRLAASRCGEHGPNARLADAVTQGHGASVSRIIDEDGKAIGRYGRGQPEASSTRAPPSCGTCRVSGSNDDADDSIASAQTRPTCTYQRGRRQRQRARLPAHSAEATTTTELTSSWSEWDACESAY
ncbi:hypothetical protein BJ912DRAFT_1104404 [Pholiota molesta]|nr:hypothetical protein BJ912DRAFT_1104404 [Pholiota molesta]